MKHYPGRDVSLEETAIRIVDVTGWIVKEVQAASEPQTSVAALGNAGLPMQRVDLEAYSLAAWLHDGLKSPDLLAICIEARQGQCGDEHDAEQTDRNDARVVAPIMQRSWFRQVHVKSRQCDLWRSLLVARRPVMNEMRSMENVAWVILRDGDIKLSMPSRANCAGKACKTVASVPLVKPLVTCLPRF